MHMATKVRRWTRAELARLPDDGHRYEVLDGELFVTPQASFPHQRIATQLSYLLIPYVEANSLGVVVGPGAVIVGDNELQPDVQVVPVSPTTKTDKWDRLPRPILVVEVLSRITRRRDVGKKKQAYRRWRIPSYWVIDRFDRRALIWEGPEAEPLIVTDQIVWHPAGASTPLTIQLDRVLPPEPPIDPEE